jgi:D-alanyl-D-alanine-carboxypeptidase/D-alanyl-D-alanine-endopeptidase
VARDELFTTRFAGPAVAACLAIVSTLAPGPLRAEPASAPQSMPSDAEIREMLQIRVDVQKRATGVVVAVTEPAGHRVVAYGVRNLSDRTPVDGDTVYDIGSLTKVFTALLLTQDVARGRLSLDAPVRTCVPAASGFLAPHGGREVSFADLATHTSGLPLRPDNLVSKDPDDKYAGYSAEDLMAFLAAFKPTRPPGAAYDYSNVGFGLLGLALSRCDHADYASLIRERITGPLGMTDTALEPGPGMLRREASGYDVDFELLPHWHMGALAPAGGLRSTADDLLKFLDAALGRPPSPLTPALQALTAVERPGGMAPATAIALGWNIYRHDGREVVWKNGNVGGFRTFMGYERTTGTGVVALANMLTPEGADDIGLHLLDPSYPANLKPPRAHHEVRLDAAMLDRYVGVYQFPDSDTDIATVRREGDRLVVIAPGSGPLRLYPEGDGRFFLKIADVELTFIDVVAGRATRLVWNQDGTDQVGARTGDAPTVD